MRAGPAGRCGNSSRPEERGADGRRSASPVAAKRPALCQRNEPRDDSPRTCSIVRRGGPMEGDNGAPEGTLQQQSERRCSRTNPAPEGRQHKAWGVSPRLGEASTPALKGRQQRMVSEERVGGACPRRSAAAPAGLSDGWESAWGSRPRLYAVAPSGLDSVAALNPPPPPESKPPARGCSAAPPR